jgi:hypothetical protein
MKSEVKTIVIFSMLRSMLISFTISETPSSFLCRRVIADSQSRLSRHWAGEFGRLHEGVPFDDVNTNDIHLSPAPISQANLNVWREGPWLQTSRPAEERRSLRAPPPFSSFWHTYWIALSAGDRNALSYGSVHWSRYHMPCPPTHARVWLLTDGKFMHPSLGTDRSRDVAKMLVVSEVDDLPHSRHICQ